jgi:hypothetical protein
MPFGCKAKAAPTSDGRCARSTSVTRAATRLSSKLAVRPPIPAPTTTALSTVHTVDAVDDHEWKTRGEALAMGPLNYSWLAARCLGCSQRREPEWLVGSRREVAVAVRNAPLPVLAPVHMSDPQGVALRFTLNLHAIVLIANGVGQVATSTRGNNLEVVFRRVGETVYAAFRNKHTLLRQVWYVSFRGDEEDIRLWDRPEIRAVIAEPDLARRFKAQAVVLAAVFRRITPLLLMLQGAVASQPAASAMLAEFGERRLDAAEKYARAAAATGQLAVSEDECRDVLSATLDGALWHRLVAERGWSDERFAAWLGQLWISALVTV